MDPRRLARRLQPPMGMDGNRSTIGVLERLAAMRDRARQVAAKVTQRVTCTFSGLSWPPKKATKPAIRLVDQRPTDGAGSEPSGR